MTARITAAQARKLGVDAPTKARTTRKVSRGAKYHTRCVTEGCGAEFRTEAAEERHLVSHHHARYALVLTVVP